MKYLKVVVVAIFMILILGVGNSVFATDTSAVENYIKDKKINVNNITSTDILNMYQDLSKEYSNDEIADMIDSYSAELEQGGINSNTISTGTKVLRQTDASTINEVLEDVNIDEVKEKLDNGESAEEILKDMQENMSTTKKASIVGKILLSNKTVKNVLTVVIIYAIIMIILKGLIFVKARRHFLATFIPVYRDGVLFKICGYSYWWLILLFIPVIGWFMYGILKLIMNFELAKSFEKGFFFGLGIWLLKPIFELIIIFNKKIQYVEIEE